MIEQIHPVLPKRVADIAQAYLQSGRWITEDYYTVQFENRIREFLDTDFCSCVPNGTLALILSLLALGIKPGDKVIVPALTMIATANAVKFIGAEPVFVDVDMNGCMRLEKIQEGVKAVIYVSLNGSSSNLNEIERICKENEIWLIEDACQSFGSMYDGRYLGTIGDVGVFSFSPHKIITTGQGGAIVTKKKSIYQAIERLKDFGRDFGGRDYHPEFGINAKFTDLQALIGLCQLEEIQDRLDRKKKVFEWYLKNSYEAIFCNLKKDNVPWFVGIWADNPAKLQDKLYECGICTRRMYPSIPMQPCYFSDKRFPMTEQLSHKILWLPSSIDLTEKEVELVCRNVKLLSS